MTLSDITKAAKKRFSSLDKYEKHLPLITGFLLLYPITLGLIYMTITAFDVPVTHFALISAVTIFCLFFSAVSSLKKLRRAIYLCYTALLLVLILLFKTPLTQSALTFVGRVYRQASITFPLFTEKGPEVQNEDSTLFFTAVALFLGLIFSLVIFERCSIVASAAAAAPLLILCYYLSGPSVFWQFTFFIPVFILLLTYNTRRSNKKEGAKFAAQLFIPIILLMLLTSALWPASRYSPEHYPYKLSFDIFYSVSDLFTTYPEFPNPYVEPDSWTDLSKIGPHNPSYEAVMFVRASESKSFYLRGKAYSIYANGGWQACESDSLTDINFMPRNSGIYSNAEFLEIDTIDPLPIIYTPYYALESSAPVVMYGDSHLVNTENKASYTIKYSNYINHSYYDSDYDNFLNESATYLPEDLSAALYEIAKEAGITELERSQIPYAVCEFVQNSARYDLNTPQVPEGKNLILWFLTESKRGYCVHFASACTAMLRALDIPSRYVVGYYVNYETKGEWATVEGRQAHAWTEYYSSRSGGWTPLEPTGRIPGSLQDASEVSESDTTESSAPAETSHTTMPTTTTTTAFVNAQPDGVIRTGVAQVSSSDVAVSASDVGKSEAEDNPASGILVAMLIFLAAALLAISILLLLRQITLIKRDREIKTGSTNRRAIALWKHCVKLCKALDTPADEDVLSIALKAKFSRHKLSESELSSLNQYYESLLEKLSCTDSKIKSLIHRYINFLY